MRTILMVVVAVLALLVCQAVSPPDAGLTWEQNIDLAVTDVENTSTGIDLGIGETTPDLAATGSTESTFYNVTTNTGHGPWHQHYDCTCHGPNRNPATSAFSGHSQTGSHILG